MTDRAKDKNLEIIIEYAQSYKYDLTRSVYTVFYLDKPTTEIKFSLSNEEKNKIIEKYYDLRIHKISGIDKEMGTIYIQDRCWIMPKLYTILHVKAKNRLQDIQIDESCDDFHWRNSNRAKRINKFLQLIDEILQSKPEIKNAPKSDIGYM